LFRPRIIPVLLLQNGALVKSIAFKNHHYIGDPLNAIRIFNEHGADELVVLDIDATRNKTCIDYKLVAALGEEADMPLSVGGGIHSIAQIKQLIAAGAEKVIIGTAACTNEQFVQAASDVFGGSTITVCMDVGQNWVGQERVYHSNGRMATLRTPEAFAEKMEKLGAGELIVQSISRDGTMKGYDIRLLRRIAGLTTLPIVALGGAGSFQHLAEGFHEGMATGLAAGSLFVYNNAQRGVLINYPDSKAFLNHA
jgi:imidazole glycerol-phosphate synthase subunit HisF